MKITKSKLEELGFKPNRINGIFYNIKLSDQLILVVNTRHNICHLEFCWDCQLESDVLKINTDEDLETFLKYFSLKEPD